MADSDADYMSDKLLTECITNDIRPGLLFNKTQKRIHQIYKREIENRTAKKRKSYREQEKETREKGLNTAISSNNVGFKMLQKMGFTIENGIGKTANGIKEPLNVKINESYSGVGREEFVKEKLKTKHKLKAANLIKQEREFRVANIEKNLTWILKRDFSKAQSVCEELDARNNINEPIEDYYWTKESIKKLRKDKYEDLESDEEESISEEKLCIIIKYLRDTYLYCIYCAITGNDKEDLESSCPGYYRSDHDEDLILNI